MRYKRDFGDITVKQAVRHLKDTYLEGWYDVEDRYLNTPDMPVIPGGINRPVVESFDTKSKEVFIFNTIQALEVTLNDGTGYANYLTPKEHRKLVQFIIEGIPAIAESFSKHRNFSQFVSTPSFMAYCIDDNGNLQNKVFTTSTYNIPESSYNIMLNKMNGRCIRRHLMLESAKNHKQNIDLFKGGVFEMLNNDSCVFFPYSIMIGHSYPFTGELDFSAEMVYAIRMVVYNNEEDLKFLTN